LIKFEVRTTVSPTGIIGRRLPCNPTQRRPRGCKAPSCHIYEILAARFNRQLQLLPVSFDRPASLDPLVNWPDLLIDGLGCFYNVVVSHKANHSESLVPWPPVHQAGNDAAVWSHFDGSVIQHQGKLNHHIR